MLKLNCKKFALITKLLPDLNTSYVEVKQAINLKCVKQCLDLNTSYVEVKHKLYLYFQHLK